MDERYTPWGNWHPVSWDEVDAGARAEIARQAKQIHETEQERDKQERLRWQAEADLAEAVELAKDAQARAEAAISQLEATLHSVRQAVAVIEPDSDPIEIRRTLSHLTSENL